MLKRMTGARALLPALALSLMVQMPFARAEIVDTDALAAPDQVEVDRAKVRSFVERANVRERLEAMGVSGLVSADRVASLSEQEVHALAQRIEGMPAGAALTYNDMILILLVAILVAIAL